MLRTFQMPLLPHCTYIGKGTKSGNPKSTCIKHLIMPSAEVFYCVYLVILLTIVSVEANSVDPVQEHSGLGLHCLTQRLLKHFSRRLKQMILL